jgi:hypothetical protein
MRKQPRTEKAPEILQNLLWIVNPDNLKKHWRALLLIAIFLTIWSPFTPKVIDQLRSHFSTVTMRITAFDHSTGKVTVEFDNQTQDTIPVEHAYLTVHPPNNASLNPLPPDLKHLITVFDKRVMRIPGWSGIKVDSSVSKDKEKDVRYIDRAIFLVRSSDDVVLPPKTQTITSFTPHGTAFADLCDQFANGTELEIILHIALLNKKERVCTRNLTIGKYSIGAHHKQFAYDPQLKKIDVLRKAEHIRAFHD